MKIYFDKNGKPITEGTKVRVWLIDEVEPEGGFWWYATVKTYLTDTLFVMQDGFNYRTERPSTLKEIIEDYQEQIEVIG